MASNLPLLHRNLKLFMSIMYRGRILSPTGGNSGKLTRYLGLVVLWRQQYPLTGFQAGSAGRLAGFLDNALETYMYCRGERIFFLYFA